MKHIPMKVLTRLLSANLGKEYTTSVISECYERGMFPIQRLGKMNGLIRNYATFSVMRFFYRYVFLPYVKPFIGRN
jgi:hypothetical protein